MNLVDYSQVHGGVLHRMLTLTDAFEVLAEVTDLAVKVNRLYLNGNGDVITFNISVDGQVYVINADPNSLEVWKSCKKPDVLVKRQITLEELTSGQFQTKFDF